MSTTTTDDIRARVREELTMKAITSDRYGTPEVLRFDDTTRPHVGPDDILVAAGTVRPVIASTFDLTDTAAVFELVETGHAGGEVVVTVGSSTSEDLR